MKCVTMVHIRDFESMGAIFFRLLHNFVISCYIFVLAQCDGALLTYLFATLKNTCLFACDLTPAFE